MIESGIFEMSYKEYDNLPAVRGSYLWKLRYCPASAKIEDKEETKALRFGRALHSLVLEPQKFREEWSVALPCSATIKSGPKKGNICGNPGSIELADGWVCGRHSGGGAPTPDTISMEEFEDMTAMAENINSHPSSKELMSKGQPEMTLVWYEEETETWCKARPDWIPRVDNVILNLKSARTVEYDPFRSQVNRMGYAMSAGMQLRGLSKLRKVETKEMAYGIIAVEKTRPFRIEVYELEDEWIEWGVREFLRLLRIEKECADTNSWPPWKNPGVDVLLKPPYLD